jgi:adenosine deaminase
MEFLQANWFSFLMLAVLVIDRAWTRGKRDEKMQQVIDKVSEIETKLDTASENFNKHCQDPDIHINKILLKLFDERFEAIKKDVGEGRTDIQRVETMLQKM